MNNILTKVMNKEELNEGDVDIIVTSIVENSFFPTQLSAILCSQQTKGVTSDELSLFVSKLMKQAKTIDLPDAVDMCGTGGDKSHTFNISTAVMFVAAGAGVKIAKHGNKAVSSSSGSFDVLEELGCSSAIEKPAETFSSCGVGLLFAPLYHPAFKNVGPLRKELGVRTIFNMMGPLLNPADVKKQVIGVFSPSVTSLFAEALVKLGREGMVVHGNGLDEITITGKTTVSEAKDGSVSTYEIDPTSYGISTVDISALQVSDKKESAEIITCILDGKKGPHRDIVVLNTAAVLKTAGVASSIEEGITQAEEAIDSGKAKEVLEKLRQ